MKFPQLFNGLNKIRGNLIEIFTITKAMSVRRHAKKLRKKSLTQESNSYIQFGSQTGYRLHHFTTLLYFRIIVLLLITPDLSLVHELSDY